MRKETLERCIRLLKEVKYDVPTIAKYNNIDYVLEVLKHEQVSNQHRTRTLVLMKKRRDYEEENKRQNGKEK